MRKYITVASSIFGIFMLFACAKKSFTGKAWERAALVPGRIECEYFDLGGEGIAYHDMDSINNGSGKLNPANGTYLNEFRMKEGVDLSYTKSNNIDNNAYNLVNPEMNHLYVGWTKPGEWINYTIHVKKTANYKIGLMYTCNGAGGISFSLDGHGLTDTIEIPTTHHDGDSVAWRQWHHWNYVDHLAEVNIEKGMHVLTLHTRIQGDMNYDYVVFAEVKK